MRVWALQSWLARILFSGCLILIVCLAVWLERSDGRPDRLDRLTDAAVLSDDAAPQAPFIVLTIASPAQAAVLHRQSRAIDPGSLRLEDIAERMTMVARRHGAAGLAAVQLGLPINIVVLRRLDRDFNGRFHTFINPVVIARSGDLLSSFEYCLSVPYGLRRTRRPSSIRVSYQLPSGKRLTELIEGETAVVLQHEIDHLHGRLLSDDVRPGRFIPFDRFRRFSDKLFSFCYVQRLPDQECHFLIETAWLRRRRAATNAGIHRKEKVGRSNSVERFR